MNLRVVAPTVVRPDEEFAIKIVPLVQLEIIPLVQLEGRAGIFQWIMLGHRIFPGEKLGFRLGWRATLLTV